MRIIFLTVMLMIPVWAQAGSFADWKQNMARTAQGQGVSNATISVFLREAQFMPRVIELDRKQPEKKISFVQYYANVVNDQRISQGRRMMREHKIALMRASDRYGVPPQIITALWGIESNFGQNQGDWSVLSTLSTLAYEGRRADFFRTELIRAMQILDKGDITPTVFRGSWAGAMGQCQFMPSSYVMYATDGDGDGLRDIWGNRADVFASAANYLSQSGWDANLPWGARATLDHPIADAFVGLDDDQGRRLDDWARIGVRPQNLRLPPSTRLWLVAPDGLGGPTYLVTRNYKVIMKWNKSTYFASSVGHLSDEIRGTQTNQDSANDPSFNH